ncbi:hypothetical protein RJ640_011683 [Escallonia rubra]|uniref:Retrotransposon gag domain-containing protein n=1 Tax=Escallonia rubra TaxID=112253 RepID=A0AA88QLL9_9ASTE|nr:hypothetical protein RJ640_011683 [Escallonia rubra]
MHVSQMFLTKRELKVKLVGAKLRGPTSTWWKHYQNDRDSRRKAKIQRWDKMKEKLKAQFLPRDYDQTLYQRVQNLRRHEKTVKEYSQEFHKLSLRSNLAEMDSQKVSRYVNGLRLAIQDQAVYCDVVPMDACHILLGRPWQYDRKTMHDGVQNTYSFFVKDGERKKKLVLKLMKDDIAKKGKGCSATLLNIRDFLEECKESRIVDDAMAYAENLKEVQEEVREKLAEMNQRYEEAADRHRRFKEFKVGDFVMVFLRKERLPTDIYTFHGDTQDELGDVGVKTSNEVSTKQKDGVEREIESWLLKEALGLVGIKEGKSAFSRGLLKKQKRRLLRLSSAPPQLGYSSIGGLGFEDSTPWRLPIPLPLLYAREASIKPLFPVLFSAVQI